jgi:hypothetical protein
MHPPPSCPIGAAPWPRRSEFWSKVLGGTFAWRLMCFAQSAHLPGRASTPDEAGSAGFVSSE